MTDYDKQYRIQSRPESTLDGSAMVNHDIFAIAQDVGDGGWFVIPGRHKTVQVPASELTVVLDMANGASKVAAYKDALARNLNTQGTAAVGWSEAQLEELLDANDLASYEADRANTFILDVAGPYPVDFSM